QLIPGINVPSVKEKALQKRINLQELIDYAKSLEQTKGQMQEMESHMPATVHKVSKGALKLPGMVVKGEAVTSVSRCYRCLNPHHMVTTCPFKSKRYFSCVDCGHTQAACRKNLNSRSATVKQLREDDEYADQSVDDVVYDIFHVHQLGGARE
ncbi:hypothetical protein SK128_024851, partial [Halocaridina rubra]